MTRTSKIAYASIVLIGVLIGLNSNQEQQVVEENYLLPNSVACIDEQSLDSQIYRGYTTIDDEVCIQTSFLTEYPYILISEGPISQVVIALEDDQYAHLYVPKSAIK